MTHGSLFSGIGGFDLGAERAGLQNLWACEIDEFTGLMKFNIAMNLIVI